MNKLTNETNQKMRSSLSDEIQSFFLDSKKALDTIDH